MRFPLAALALILSTSAAAAGTVANVSIIDRDTGETLPVHRHQGELWVAGRPGAHYAIRIQSRDGRRLLAVTSVDGVNVVTGETAGHHQRGYVFDAWQGYDIAGWRKSGSEIAAFTFTALPRSYAAQTGRPDHIGVIGVALFREKRRPIPPPPPPAVHGAPATAPSARAESRASRSEEAKADASLGTGHGRREHSMATQVPFERDAGHPDEVIRFRYDSRENLVALGVLPRARPPRPRPVDPFPDSRLGYVPDP